MTRPQEVCFSLVMYAVLTFAVAMFVGSCAQVVLGQDISKFERVGVNEELQTVFLVDKKNANYKGNRVFFVGLAGRYLGDDKDGSAIIDGNNHIFSVFDADCSTYQFSVISEYGYLGGEKFARKSSPTKEQARPKQAIYKALEMVCGGKKNIEA